MSIFADVQKLEPGDHVVLFELDATEIDGPLLRFHGYTQIGPIYWQGEEYSPWAIQIEGTGSSGDSQQPSPTLTVSNIGVDASGETVNGVVSALCSAFDDLINSKVIIHETLGKYLDAANFPEGNDTADPEAELPINVLYVEQKLSEDNIQVQFVLNGILSFDGVMLPRRSIVSSVCPWIWIGGYRGSYCQYTGTAYFKEDNTPTENASEDVCGGRVSSCKLRFGENNTINYGGFPAADSTAIG